MEKEGIIMDVEDRITSTIVNGQTLVMLHNYDNMQSNTKLPIDLAFADYMYEDTNFEWVDKFWKLLKKNGIFIAMSDYHSDFRFRTYMEDHIGATFVNDAKWKNEWGSHPRNRMHQCFDSVMIYCKGDDWYFNSEVIQVPKKTLTKGLNPSGRLTKTATAWIDDITLTTTAKERVKKKNGKLAEYQKPLRLYDRIIAPFCKEKTLVADLFMGVGSLGRWCVQNKRHYLGYEIDEEKFELAHANILNP
jgi:DNA modification methylase